MNKFERISEHPYSGHMREDLTELKVRFYPIYSYVIIYKPDSKPLEIVRILSGYRDARPLL